VTYDAGVRIGLAPIVVVAAIVPIGSRAMAEPGAIRRVVLVNPTPDLAHAARTALAPWTIEVVEETRTSPVDATLAASIAHDRVAERVAWLDGGELVVVDPATGEGERRPAPAGADDAPAAASVALSLKTLLRLPPIPVIAPPVAAPPVAAPPVAVAATSVPPEPAIAIAAPPGRRLRIVPEVGGGVRFALGSRLAPQPRVAVGAGFAHAGWAGLRPSLVAGFGPAVDAGTAGLQGTWSDIELGAQVVYLHSITSRVAVVPRIRVSAHRTRVWGRLPPQDTLDVVSYGAETAFGGAVWVRAGRVRAGVGGEAGAWLGLPDYIRRNNVVFESASVTAQVYGTVLVDL
jgi:hypothetical protein